MFGKLFSYLSIVRSGRLLVDEETSLNLLTRLLELHRKRGWMREVVCESILSLLWAISECPSVVEKALAEINTAGLLSESLTDYTPWQLLLALGLQRFASNNSGAKAQIYSILPEKRVFTPDTLPLLVPALLASSAGFPKIHRMWDYILGLIFGMDSDRKLPTTRYIFMVKL